jgi:formate dehydrogenase subunit gamma
MADYEPWDIERAREIIAELAPLEGATLPMLHALQAAFGHVPDEAVKLVADALNFSHAEVHGCLTFYHDFHRHKAGRHVLKLCRAEACQSVGADRLHAEILAELGVEWRGTSADGRITAEPVFCLGLCACGPAALLDGAPLARLDAASLRTALADAGAAA